MTQKSQTENKSAVCSPRAFNALLLLMLVILSAVVFRRPDLVLPADQAFTEFVQGFRCASMDQLMIFISAAGYYPSSYFLVFVLSAGFFLTRNIKESLFILLTLIAQFFNVLFKISIHRPRPDSESAFIYHILKDPSFPSGHVVYYTVLFGFLFVSMDYVKHLPKFIRMTVKSASLFFAAAVSLSRVYLGAHWASDVLAGYLTGFLFLQLILSFYFRHVNTLEQS